MAATLVFAPVAHMGLLYVVAAAVLGVVFLAFGVRLKREQTARAAMQLFQYSITYLTLLFVAMAVDVLIRHP